MGGGKAAAYIIIYICLHLLSFNREFNTKIFNQFNLQERKVLHSSYYRILDNKRLFHIILANTPVRF